MNTYKIITFAGLLSAVGVAGTGAAWADASYQETVQISGGSMVESLRSMPFGQSQIRKMFEPINSQTMLHGNQLATVSKSSTQIIDLDRETVTRIDNEKKTYSVMTFDQMRQALKDAQHRLEQAQAQQAQQPAADAGSQPPLQVTFDVSVSTPGVSKVINGVMAQEQLMVLKAHVTDPNAQPAGGPNTVTYTYMQDIWTAPEPVELRQIDDFYGRYGQALMRGVDTTALMKSMRPALSGASIGAIFGSNPQMGTAFQQMTQRMATEMQKIHGVTVLEITRLGGETMPATAGTGAAPPPPAAPDQSSAIAGQAATDTASNVAGSQIGRLGALGSALGSSMFGAFHHSAPPPKPASTTGATPSSAVLFETTTQKSAFSQEIIPSSAFDIPAGYRRVDAIDVNQVSR
jgi:hypothetical protein